MPQRQQISYTYKKYIKNQQESNTVLKALMAYISYMPCPSPPSVGAEAPSAAKQMQRSSSFPWPIHSHTDRCSWLRC